MSLVATESFLAEAEEKLMCLDKQTKRVLANPDPNSSGTILEVVLRDQSIVLWTDLIPVLESRGWENERVLEFFRWIDKYVPVLHANGKVDPTALCWALLEAQRKGIAKIAREPDARRIDPRDRLIRNAPWLKKLCGSKRISNGKIREAVEMNVLLDGDRNLLEGILCQEGVVTPAGNVKPTLLRQALEAHGFNVADHYELTLAGPARKILFPEPDPAATPTTPVRALPAPEEGAGGEEPSPRTRVEVRTISKRMAAAHRSLLVVLGVLVSRYGWRREQNLLPPVLIRSVLGHFWPKGDPERCWDWMENNNLLAWYLTALDVPTVGAQYVLFHVPPSPLVCVRRNDFTDVQALNPGEAKRLIAEAFRSIGRKPAEEPPLIRTALATAQHRSS